MVFEMDVVLDAPLAADCLSEAAYWLYFASPNIARFYIDPVERRRVHVWSLAEDEESEIDRKVRMTLARFAQSTNVIDAVPRRVGIESSGEDVKGADPAGAADAGLVRRLGLADTEIGELMTALARGFDDEFRRLGTSMGACEREYSTLLPIEFFEKCHYFDAFPQNIMYPTMMQTDVDAAEKFSDYTVNHRGRPPRDYSGFQERTHVLAPAACFHVYMANEEKTLEGNTLVTTRGTCYRYEGRNASTLERLWDFQMREIVYLGSRQFVRDCRDETQERVLRLVEQWGLSGVVEAGHDPFFLRGERPECELDPDAKFELRLDLPYRDADSACASFNISGTFFGSTSNIMSSDGGTAWTGCTAFGLERWAWAAVMQHGTNPARWPHGLRAVLEGAR